MVHIDLTNKSILVTGASDGIGKGVADFLMRMGGRVAVHYNSNKTSAEALVAKYPKTNSKVFKADLSKKEEVLSLFSHVQRDFKKIDVILMNAGIFLPHSTNETVDDWFSIWEKTMAVNLDAVGVLTKLGITHFIEKGGGRFIYIGSRAVFRGETEEYLAYAASKGGIVSLARSVARSFGKQHIKSFIISPGFTRTQMAESFIKKYGEEKILQEIALTDLTKPQDLAPLIGLICSGAMDHATGATIDVNAGSHIR